MGAAINKGKATRKAPKQTSQPARAAGLAKKKLVITKKAHRTSQGLEHAPLNKRKRRDWKRYRGQGPRRK